MTKITFQIKFELEKQFNIVVAKTIQCEESINTDCVPTDPPEVRIEESWQQSGDFFEVLLSCSVTALPPAKVLTITQHHISLPSLCKPKLEIALLSTRTRRPAPPTQSLQTSSFHSLRYLVLITFPFFPGHQHNTINKVSRLYIPMEPTIVCKI